MNAFSLQRDKEIDSTVWECMCDLMRDASEANETFATEMARQGLLLNVALYCCVHSSTTDLRV